MHRALAKSGMNESPRWICWRFNMNDFNLAIAKPFQKNRFIILNGGRLQQRGSGFAHINICFAQKGKANKPFTNFNFSCVVRRLNQPMILKRLNKPITRWFRQTRCL